MSTVKDAGPAFPSTATDDSLHIPGMTLRDYFAAAWLQGAAADPNVRNWRYDAGKHAVTAYAVADAMLRAREAA